MQIKPQQSDDPPYEQAFGDSGKEKKIPSNNKKPLAEPGSGRGGHLRDQLGTRGGRQDKSEREPQVYYF